MCSYPKSDLLLVVAIAWNLLLVGKSSASHLREAVFYSSLAAGSCSPGSEPFPWVFFFTAHQTNGSLS